MIAETSFRYRILSGQELGFGRGPVVPKKGGVFDHSLLLMPADQCEEDLQASCWLTPADQQLVAQQRRGSNRLGFAIQLAPVRHCWRVWQA